jgi:hypothetical protein
LRKPKGCAICREKFLPFSTLAKVCGTTCAIEWAKRQRVKAEKKQTREWRKANMTRGDLLKKAQTEFNRFIRLRDHDKPCISCGVINPGTDETGQKWDAGHFRTVGSAPELRFEELNCHRQCKRCNKWLGGNFSNYRIGLIARIGQNKLEWLEGPHPVQKYSRDDLRDIADKYRAAANQLHKMIQTTWSQHG